MLKLFTLVYCIMLFFKIIYATDYCKICKDKSHTLCKYMETGPAESCLNYSTVKMTPEAQAVIVNLHNDIRNKVASGLETRGKVGPQPFAKNMLRIEWDDELAEIAQRWIDQCTLITEDNQHDECKTVDRFYVGQNLIVALEGAKPLSFNEMVAQMVSQWYSGVEHLDPQEIDQFGSDTNSENETGHYTQLVWATTKYTGCAYVSYITKVSDQDTLIHKFICNYGPTGNVIGAAVYQEGVPCSECICSNEYPALCVDTPHIIDTPATSRNQEWSTSRFGKRSYSYVELPQKLYELFEMIKIYNQHTNNELMRELNALYDKYNVNNTLRNVSSTTISTMVDNTSILNYVDDGDKMEFRRAPNSQEMTIKETATTSSTVTEKLSLETTQRTETLETISNIGKKLQESTSKVTDKPEESVTTPEKYKTETLIQTERSTTIRKVCKRKPKKCTLDNPALRYRLLHREGDECYCLYRLKGLATKLLAKNVFIVLIFSFTLFL